MTTDNKNTILAIILSALVLIGWQYFYGAPAEKARQQTIEQQAAKPSPAPTAPGQVPAPTAAPQVPNAQTTAPASRPRAEVLAASPRVPIATDSVRGSTALKGGPLDDLAPIKAPETADKNPPPLFL